MEKYFENDRLDLVYRLFCAKMASAQAINGYLNVQRNYSSQSTLYMREAHFIMALSPGEGKTMSAIAEALSITQGAASQIATRLEKKGYIQRCHSTEDRRLVLVFLSELGEAFYFDHKKYDEEHFRQIEEFVTSRYTDEEIALLTDYENRMTELFLNQEK